MSAPIRRAAALRTAPGGGGALRGIGPIGLPVQTQLAPFCNAVTPDIAPGWQWRCQFQFLFPRCGRRPMFTRSPPWRALLRRHPSQAGRQTPTGRRPPRGLALALLPFATAAPAADPTIRALSRRAGPVTIGTIVC